MAQIPQLIDYGIPAMDYSAVGQSLAQLGQQVGQSLAMREYQRQAQAQLPFMQEAMKNAMGKIEAGDVAGGYMDAMMNLPIASQNPIVQAAANNYFSGLQQAAEFKQSSLWQDLQRSRMGGGGTTTTTGLPAVSGVEEARARMGVGGAVPQAGAMGATRDAIDAEAAANLPTDQINILEENPDMVPSEEMQAQFTDTDISAANNAAVLASTPVDQRPEIIGANIAYTQNVDTSKYKKITVPGLKRLYGTDEIYVPPPETTITASTRASSAQGGFTETLNEVLIGKEEYEKSVTEARKLSDYISVIKSQKPTGSDRKLESLINEAGGIAGISLQPNDEYNSDKYPMLMTYSAEKEPVALNDKQAEAVANLFALTSKAPSNGWVFGKGAVGPTMAAKTFTTMQEAEQSGLPPGSTVYIQGKRRVIGGQPAAQPAGSPIPTNLLDMFPQR